MAIRIPPKRTSPFSSLSNGREFRASTTPPPLNGREFRDATYVPASPGPAATLMSQAFRGGSMSNNNGGQNGTGANGNQPKTGGKLPPAPATPSPQWAFQPSPYDQSPYGAPGGPGPGPASQYQVNLPTQPWMLNPMGQPQQQQPQATQYNQQWAPPYPNRY